MKVVGDAMVYGACTVCRAPRGWLRVVTWKGAHRHVEHRIACSADGEHDATDAGPLDLLLRPVPPRPFGQR